MELIKFLIFKSVFSLLTQKFPTAGCINMHKSEKNYWTEERSESPLLDFFVVPTVPIPVQKDWSKRSCALPKSYAQNIENVLNFEVRKDDVWIVTPPKCGTTWMQEAAWLVYNDFNFEDSSKNLLLERSPYLEFSELSENNKSIYDSLAISKSLASPRLIKSHLPANMIPKGVWEQKCKVIFVVRDFKDASVSGYHHARGLGFIEDLSVEEFFERNIQGNRLYQFWCHVLEFWEMRNERNVFFTSFEMMKKDLRLILIKLCEFLEKEIPEPEILDEAERRLSFEYMKKSVESMDDVFKNYPKKKNDFKFCRKGEVGTFRNELSEELIKKVDALSTKQLHEANVLHDDIFTYLK